MSERSVGTRGFASVILPIAVTVLLAAAVVIIVGADLRDQQRTQPADRRLQTRLANPAYELVKRIPLQVEEARGIAVHEERGIAVCGNGSVAVLSADGGDTEQYAIPGNGTCMAFLDESILIVGLQQSMVEIDLNTGVTREWTLLDERTITTSVAVEGNSVYIADAGTRQVWVFSRGGKLENIIGGFIVPSPYFDVAGNGDGTMQIVDPGRHTVNRYDASGNVVTAWGHYAATLTGFGGCCNPTDIAVSYDGRIVTSEKGIIRIKVYDRTGTFLGLVADARNIPRYDAEIDIAVDSAGRILVLSPALSEILVYQEAG